MSRFSHHRILIAAALTALAACGRNPGPVARSYPVPGIEKIQHQMELGKTKCLAFDPKSLGVKTAATGKDKFKTEAAGKFRLQSYEISGILDQVDRSVPNYALRVTEFQPKSPAADAALVVEADCLDLKGTPQMLSFSPVTEIDAKSGMIAAAQPFSVAVATNGTMKATSAIIQTASTPVSVDQAPEAAILLGQDYMQSVQMLSFDVTSDAGGSLRIDAEFAGFDQNLTRRLFQVRAVYSLEAAS